MTAALAGGRLAFQGFFPDVLALGLGHAGEEREQGGAAPGRGVDPLEGAGEEFELDVVVTQTDSGRTLIRVLIFSEKTGSHPASARASSWLWNSCRAVLHLAYPTLVGFVAASGTAASTAGPLSHARPGPRTIVI